MPYTAVNPHKLVAQRLATYPEVTALVPPSQQSPGGVPQNAPMPFITWNQVSDDSDRTLDGASGLKTPRMQIDIYTRFPVTGYGQADQIAIAVRHALEDYEGLRYAGRNGPFPEYDTQLWHVTQDFQGLLIED